MGSSDISPILIIGAGLGGLALAHGLHGAGIPFHVYERDPSPTFRAQGYRVRISPEGAEALYNVIPASQWNSFENRCAQNPLGMSSLDAITGKPHETAHKPMMHRPQRAKFGSYSADRVETRTLLLEGLEGHISFGKELARFETTDSHGVMAHFADGTAVEGSMLVGADGVRSKVRRQNYLPQAPVDTQGRAIYGKTPLTPELEKAMAEEIGTKACLVQDRSGSRGASVVSLYIEAVRFPVNESVHPPDYVYWVLIAPRAAFVSEGEDDNDVVPHLSHQEAKDLSLRVASRWDASITAALKAQDTSQTAGLRICSAVPSTLTWTSSPHITAIGDAIHVAPPAGGQGANLAIKDAWMLVEALKEHGVGAEAIRVYEEKMQEYAASAVQASLGGGKWMFDQLDYDQCQLATF